MEDQEKLRNPSPRIPACCDECGSNPWKYRCPGCTMKTCCLPCVKSHKDKTGCTGKRNRTEFVPLSRFDDNLLISDYSLLEEMKRATESARRVAAFNGFRSYYGSRLPVKLHKLRNAALRMNTRLLLLPRGMSKREMNRSYYDSRKKSIIWTVEWRFHSTDVVLVDHGINEHVSLSSVIEKHLLPTPLKNQLSPFRNTQLDDLKFFLRKSPKGLKSPFRELSINVPIGEQLEDVLILEYPVIYVLLPSHSYDFEVEKHATPSSKNKEPPGSVDSIPSPKGTLFMEEEIEDDLPYGGLVDHMNLVPSVAAKVVHDSDMQIPGTSTAVGGLKHEASAVDETTDTANDFQQELRDVYSELIGEMDPDDFLCLDSVYNEVENMQLFWDEEEELEEGEIPSQ